MCEPAETVLEAVLNFKMPTPTRFRNETFVHFTAGANRAVNICSQLRTISANRRLRQSTCLSTFRCPPERIDESGNSVRF